MHIELRHLRLVQAIHETGSVAAAAERLHVTQSALSHQIKGIEDQVGVPLFVRRSKPLRLSGAGQRFLAAAEAILPRVDALRDEFEDLQGGRTGRLHIAMECHACFEWLFPVLDQFRRAWPEVDLDVRPGLAFDAMSALAREQVDLVISSDPGDEPGVRFMPLFDYRPMAVMPRDHPLAAGDHVSPADLGAETLITYPMDRAKLDVFAHFLTPAGVVPEAVRQVELTQMILLLVSAGRGVTVLPDWVLRGVWQNPELTARPLGAPALTRRLFAAVRDDDAMLPFMAHVVRLARQEALRLQR